VKPDGNFVDERGCTFPVEKLFPSVRRKVYNGTFTISVPNDYDAVLNRTFGKNWRTPDSRKKSHGLTRCKTKPEVLIRNAYRRDSWNLAWNAILKDEFYSLQDGFNSLPGF
jgi:hypothetical protein